MYRSQALLSCYNISTQVLCIKFLHYAVAESFFLVVQHISSFQIIVIVLFFASKLSGFNFLAVVKIAINLNDHGIVSL